MNWRQGRKGFLNNKFKEEGKKKKDVSIKAALLLVSLVFHSEMPSHYSVQLTTDDQSLPPRYLPLQMTHQNLCHLLQLQGILVSQE